MENREFLCTETLTMELSSFQVVLEPLFRQKKIISSVNLQFHDFDLAIHKVPLNGFPRKNSWTFLKKLGIEF